MSIAPTKKRHLNGCLFAFFSTSTIRVLLRFEVWLFSAVSTTELVYLTSGIHDFLLASVERMARRTHFDTQISSSSGTRFKRVTAAARDCDLFVFGMYFRFHSNLPVIKKGTGY